MADTPNPCSDRSKTVKKWTQEERQKAASKLSICPDGDADFGEGWYQYELVEADKAIDLQCELNEAHKLILAALADYQRYGTITRAEQDDLEVWLERNK